MSRALTMSSFSNCPAACMSSTASAAKTCLRSAANTGEDGSSKPALQRLGTFTALSTAPLQAEARLAFAHTRTGLPPHQGRQARDEPRDIAAFGPQGRGTPFGAISTPAAYRKRLHREHGAGAVLQPSLPDQSRGSTA